MAQAASERLEQRRHAVSLRLGRAGFVVSAGSLTRHSLDSLLRHGYRRMLRFMSRGLADSGTKPLEINGS